MFTIRWKPRSSRAIRTNFRRSLRSRSPMASLPTSDGLPLKPASQPKARKSGGSRRAIVVHMAALLLAPSLLVMDCASAQRNDLLEPERAFALSAQPIDPATVEVTFRIADGYYLYRDRLKFALEPGPLAAAPILPP